MTKPCLLLPEIKGGREDSQRLTLDKHLCGIGVVKHLDFRTPGITSEQILRTAGARRSTHTRNKSLLTRRYCTRQPPRIAAIVAAMILRRDDEEGFGSVCISIAVNVDAIHE